MTLTVNLNWHSPDGLAAIKELLMSNQEKLNAIGAALEDIGANLATATTGIAADLAALKAAAEAGQPLDFAAVDGHVTTLQAAAAALTALDAANPS